MLENAKQLEVGKTYVLKTDEGAPGKVTLEKIDHSRSGMFPSDYMFKYVEGEVEEIKHPKFYPLFPLPEGVVDKLVKAGYLTEVEN